MTAWTVQLRSRTGRDYPHRVNAETARAAVERAKTEATERHPALAPFAVVGVMEETCH